MSITTPYPIAIGASRVGPNLDNISNISTHRIYSVKVYEEDDLVRDFVPCAVGSVTGLWDRVSETFYAPPRGAYRGENPATNRLYIVSDYDIVSASPACSMYDDVAVGSNVVASVASSIVSDTMIANCTGWRLSTNGVACDSGTGNSVSYTHQAGFDVLEWLFATASNKVTFAAGAGGTVSTTGGWYAAGSNVTVTATPDAGFTFASWTGNVPEAQRYQATLSFPAAEPVAASAAFYARGSRFIDITTRGYAGSVPLTNFPVLVRLSEGITGFDYTMCRPDGADLLFLGADGRVLKHEIDTWNTNGTSFVWVCVPELTATTTLRLYFSAPDASAPGFTTDGSTWAPANFRGVWHFAAISPAGVTPDSTASGLDSTAYKPTVSTGRVDGIVGNCVLNSDDATTQVDKTGFLTANYNALAIGSTFTLSGWCRHRKNAANGWERLFSRKKGWQDSDGFEIELTNGSKVEMGVRGAAQNPQVKVPTPDISLGDWYHVSFVYKNDKLDAYVNGVRKVSNAGIVPATDNGLGLAFGSNPDNSVTTYKGCFDEFRLLDAVASADWVRAEHDTVADPAFNDYSAVGTLSTSLQVVGRPADYGIADPAYGLHEDRVEDGEYTCSVSPWVAAGEGVRYLCTGWRRYGIDRGTLAETLLDSGSSNGLTYTHTDIERLEWYFTNQYFVAVTAGSGGTVSTTGNWYTAGSGVTVTAIPDAGAAFAYWTGNVPEAQRYQATLSFPTAEPVTAAAVFGQTYHVRTDGDDSADGLSWATAKQTIEAAVAAAGGAGTIILSNGVHNVTSFWVEVTQPLTITSLNGPAVTSLKAACAAFNPTQRRVMRVNHAGALISGLGMVSAYTHDSAYAQPDAVNACALRIDAGTVTNCWILGSKGLDNSGGVDMRGGLLTHCVVANNTAHRTSNNPSEGKAGGIRLQAGTVQSCVITNNSACDLGAGLRITGGIVRDSLIAANRFRDNTSGYMQGAGVYMSGGTLERCTVVSNHWAKNGGGLYLAGSSATVRNCQFAGNRSFYDGAGVYLSSGNLRNVTVTGNRVVYEGANGLYQSGGAVSGAIVYGNGERVYQIEARNIVKTDGTFDYSCTWPAVEGTGNVAADPLFADAAAGDYRLLPGSPALDAAAVLDDVTDDLNGTARPQNGAPDMGAFERIPGTGPLTCGFTATPEEGLAPVTATLAAFADGADADLTWFGWDFDNDGIIDAAGSDKQAVSHTFGPGFHSVALTVSNASGQAATFVGVNVIRAGSATSYVSLDGSHTPPFDTWAKAATNLQDAVDAVWAWDGAVPASVWITNGNYYIPIFWVQVEKPIALRSVNGPAETVLRAACPGWRFRRVLRVNHSGAFISGLTLRDGDVYGNYAADSDNAGPGALRLVAGVVSNCVIRNNNGADNSGAVELRAGGLLTHCKIFNNQATRNGNTGVGLGGGVWVRGGVMRDCIVTNNQANLYGGGVWMSDGSVERCRIEGNTSGYSGVTGRHGGGIYLAGGSATACEIVNNRAYGYGGGAYFCKRTAAPWSSGAGALRNSLVTGNRSFETKPQNGHGLFLTDSISRLENVTVVDNSHGVDGSGIYLANGNMTNSIAWFNGTNDLHKTGGTVGHSCWSGATAADGNTGANPRFKDRARGNYRLTTGSPCVNTGVNYLWTRDDLDLEGNPRILFNVCDMGAYENTTLSRTLLIVR